MGHAHCRIWFSSISRSHPLITNLYLYRILPPSLWVGSYLHEYLNCSQSYLIWVQGGTTLNRINYFRWSGHEVFVQTLYPLIWIGMIFKNALGYIWRWWLLRWGWCLVGPCLCDWCFVLCGPIDIIMLYFIYFIIRRSACCCSSQADYEHDSDTESQSTHDAVDKSGYKQNPDISNLYQEVSTEI